MKKYDSSIYYSTKNIELVSKTQNKPDAADAYLNRSMAYHKKGMLTEALQDAETNFELTKIRFCKTFRIILIKSNYK